MKVSSAGNERGLILLPSNYSANNVLASLGINAADLIAKADELGSGATLLQRAVYR